MRAFMSVLAAELRCVVVTLWLVMTGRIGRPARLVGSEIRFADGTVSTIYRETTLEGEAGSPVVLVVRFQLRLVGRNRMAHFLFRRESLLNTVLFAGHRGFLTKLWVTDLATGIYRGIYEWDGPDLARRYAETLRVVLRPWVRRETFDYRIVRLIPRDEFLAGAGPPDVPAWCRPVRTDPHVRLRAVGA